MGPTVLVIMDGFGVREEEEGNAIKKANTPNLDRYFLEWPFTTLRASGEDVGLPTHFMGSSEVGHLNIGAGRLVKQEEVMIDGHIESGEFFHNKALLDAVHNVKEKKSNFHIIGLLSDKGVHSHINHLFAILDFCKRQNVKPIVHAITDGRDTLPRSASIYFQELDKKLTECGGVLKSIVGRYYAMDRDNRWDRTKLAYDMLNNGIGKKVNDWKEAIENSYEEGVDDEFIKPCVIDYSGLNSDDSLLFFNFRSDRPRQLTKALVEEEFNNFERDFKRIFYVGMVRYYKEMNTAYVCDKPNPRMGLGEYFSKLGWKQARIAETEKYAHVTYFFSGEREEQYEKEERILVPSPKVATYDLKPEMSAYEITEKALVVLDTDTNFVVINFANCDMVGHTGFFEGTVKAVETVDECIGRIVDKVLSKEGIVVITGDHGNAETMLTPDGGRVTSHTNTLVPLSIVGWRGKLQQGKLGDIAPTLLTILDLDIPPEMTGDVLIS